jgi:hypothetical protein
MFAFSNHPTRDEFRLLAAHLRAADEAQVHPSLWPQRAEVADRLEHMATEPDKEAHAAAYHSIRLLVWE